MTTRTVVGQYLNVDGTPVKGYLEFTPSSTIALGHIIPISTVRAMLDDTGSFTADLLVTDDPGDIPAGWLWSVDEKIPNGNQWYLAVPTSIYPLDIITAYTIGSSPVPVVGITGPAGQGVPIGGVAGDYLRKTGPANYAAAWQTFLHAASHAAAGGDPLTLSQSQITGLVAALAALAPLSSPVLTGNPTAPTPAAGDNDTSIATTAFAAERATIGNLLTANQASGGDTLAAATGTSGATYVTTGAALGAGSLQVTCPSGTGEVYASTLAPVVEGTVYTFRIKFNRTSGTRNAVTLGINWRNASNASISSTTQTFSVTVTGSWLEFSLTAISPGLAALAQFDVYQTISGGGVAGDTFLVDCLGLWAGAGGNWAMPGVPITNLGTKVSHPNVDDVLVQRWDSGLGRWQSIHYDSGVRDVSSLLLSGWTGQIYIRRNLFVTTYQWLQVENASAPSTSIMNPPMGFRTLAGHTRELSAATTGSLYLNAINIYLNGVARNNGGGWLTVSHPVEPTLPTSLPGTLVSAAPA